MLEDVYASSGVNIVMMMFFELFYYFTLITTLIKTFTLFSLALSSENVLHRITTYVES